MAHPGRTLLESSTTQCQQQLQSQEFVEDQSTTRARDVGHLGGDVDAPVRRGAVNQRMVAPQVLVQGIEQGTRALQGLLDETTHLPTGHPGLARGWIQCDDAPDATHVALLTRGADDDVDHRIGHLARSAEFADLAEENGLHAGDELPGAPGLVEEGDLHGLTMVDDPHVDQRFTLAGTPRRRGRDFAEHRRLLAHHQVREVHPASAINVAARIEGQQVENGGESQ